jgi:hypothetical protein
MRIERSERRNFLSQDPPTWSDQVRNERRSILPALLRKVSKHQLRVFFSLGLTDSRDDMSVKQKEIDIIARLEYR